MMSAKYFEYYTTILRGPFFRGHAVYPFIVSCSHKNMQLDIQTIQCNSTKL